MSTDAKSNPHDAANPEEYEKFLEIAKTLDDAETPMEGRTWAMTLEAYLEYMFVYGTAKEAAKVMQAREAQAYERGRRDELEHLLNLGVSGTRSVTKKVIAERLQELEKGKPDGE